MTAEAQPRAHRADTLKQDAVFASVLLAVAVAGFLLLPSQLALLTRIISVALLVVSLDLVTGYAGVATLGHAVVYGAGAYAAGIAATQWGITDPLAMIGVGAGAGAIAGAVSGAIVLRGRGLTQLVLSIAIVQLAHEAANKAAFLTGGSDGLSGISPSPLFGLFRFDLFGRTAFWLGAVLLVAVIVLLRYVMRSPFGMLCRGIREDAVRIAAMGIPVNGTLLRLYMLSGAVAGLGGALSAISTRVVGLDSVSFDLSANALVMLVLGGVGNLGGAVAGSAIFMLLESKISAINPFHWLTIVGAVLIAAVLFAPNGLWGLGAGLGAKWRKR